MGTGAASLADKELQELGNALQPDEALKKKGD